MKKVLFSVLFLATLSMSAQETEFESSVKKGRINLAGSLSMVLDDYDSENNTSRYKNINLRPTIGYVIQENLILGAFFDFRHGQYENNYVNNNSDVTDRNTLKGYGLGIFVKKYISVVGRLFFDLGAGVSYSRNSYEYSNDSNVDNYSDQYGVNITPGITYFLNKNLALQMSFGNITYSHIKRKYENQETIANKNNLLSLNLTSNTSLGVSYFF